MTNSKQDQITSEFISKNAENVAMLKRLLAQIENHNSTDPDSISYADISEAGYLGMQIKEISDRVFQEGEYA